jgi:hypothetical protein
MRNNLRMIFVFFCSSHLLNTNTGLIADGDNIQASFLGIDGAIEASTVSEAQVSYGLIEFKTTIKLGAANLFGNESQEVLVSSAIG